MRGQEYQQVRLLTAALPIREQVSQDRQVGQERYAVFRDIDLVRQQTAYHGGAMVLHHYRSRGGANRRGRAQRIINHGKQYS